MSATNKQQRKEMFIGLFGEMISAIRKKTKLHAFILFGSQARGNTLPHSDYDIVVVADFEKSYLKRLEWVIQIAPMIPIDLFCYTPQEFDKKFRQYNLTAIDSVEEGLVLYQDDFIEKYKELLDYYKKKGMRKGDHILHPPVL